MAREISDLKSLPFHQIIGAPLLAIVQGQAQAAQATAEYIERVGFIPSSDTDSATAEATDDFGVLRMVTFSYDKPDPEGGVDTFSVKVPLLSLVPIPSIQVKHADLEFAVKVTGLESYEAGTRLSSETPEKSDWLARNRAEFRAAMGKMETTTETKHTFDFQMNIKMEVEQADIPPGLEHLFRIMDQGASGTVKSTPGSGE